MNSSDHEVAELRTRIARLEARLEKLEGASTAPASPLLPPPLPEPPLIGASVARSSAAVAPQRVAREIPSTAWIAAAGAFIFLLGAVYGLSVAIQRGWISPAMRVGAGLVVGVAASAFAGRLLLADRRTLGVTLLAVGAGTWTFALYFGAHGGGLFPLGVGFAGATLAVLAAGFFAAYVRSDGAMAVALATGLAAPLAFSSGTGTIGALAGYLALLSGAQLVAHYLMNVGAEWRLSRALGSVGTWFVLLAGAVSARVGTPEFAVGLIVLLGGATQVLAWLPRHRDVPWEPALASIVGFAGNGLALWVVWRRAGWENESFASVLALLAGAALGIMLLARGRVGDRRHDAALLLTATGFALLAILVALEWRWVGLMWGLLAALLAWAARREATRDLAESGALPASALIAATAATINWAALCVLQKKSDWIFVNPIFGGGLLAALAWGGLMSGPVAQRGFAFVLMQFVAVNAVAWEFSRALPDWRGPEVVLPLGALLATLTYAAAGVGQWLRGVLYEMEAGRARALRLAGYAWLGAAALKLLMLDLKNAELAFRAVAALAVGALFIGAALWADRHGARAKQGE